MHLGFCLCPVAFSIAKTAIYVILLFCHAILKTVNFHLTDLVVGDFHGLNVTA